MTDPNTTHSGGFHRMAIERIRPPALLRCHPPTGLGTRRITRTAKWRLLSGVRWAANLALYAALAGCPAKRTAHQKGRAEYSPAPTG